MEKAAWNTDIVFFPAVFFDLPEQASGKWLVSYLVRTDGQHFREPIVTTKDFIALKLDTDYFGKYVISGQISNYKRKKWAEETGKRSEEHTSELQSQMYISYAVFCLK